MLALVHDFVTRQVIGHGQSMAEIRVFPVSENKGGPKIQK